MGGGALAPLPHKSKYLSSLIGDLLCLLGDLLLCVDDFLLYTGDFTNLLLCVGDFILYVGDSFFITHPTQPYQTA